MQTKIVKDMSKYQRNDFMGLSARQLLFGIAGVVFVAIIYFVIPDFGYLAVVAGMPIFLFGFMKIEGLPLEKYIKYYFESTMANSHYRYYEREGRLYKSLFAGHKGEDETKEKEKRRGLTFEKGKKLFASKGKKNDSENDTSD